MNSSSQLKSEPPTPTFLDLFGFHLAIRLFGQERVSDALHSEGDTQFREGGTACTSTSTSTCTRKRKRSLYWRSPFQQLEEMRIPLSREDQQQSEKISSSKKNKRNQHQHVFFIDVTVDFIRPTHAGSQPRVATRFGAMLELPEESPSSSASPFLSSGDERAKRAIYVQSDPWQIQDLERYAGGFICVNESGANGMAATVSDAILHSEQHMIKVKEYQVNPEDKRISVQIATFDDLVMEEVTILRAHNIVLEDGYVGPKALEIFQYHANSGVSAGNTSTATATSASENSTTQKGSLEECFYEWCKSKPEEMSPSMNVPGGNREQRDGAQLFTNDIEEDSSSQKQQVPARTNENLNPSAATSSGTTDVNQSSQVKVQQCARGANSVLRENTMSSTLTKQKATNSAPPKKRLRVVHGAARSRKRKKNGKMTFGKM